jgi:hypothetical protein
VYHLEEEEIQAEELGGGGDGGERIAAANYCLLPHASFDDIWENLIFDSNIKEKVRKGSSYFTDRFIQLIRSFDSSYWNTPARPWYFLNETLTRTSSRGIVSYCCTVLLAPGKRRYVKVWLKNYLYE